MPNLPSPSSARQYDNIIVDLGDVLLTWAPNEPSDVQSGTMRRILRSSTWFEYEKGAISEHVCYATLASELSLTPADIAEHVRAARASTRINPAMLSMLQGLKDRAGIHLFAMSNISAPDWDVVFDKFDLHVWALFDYVFTSAAAGGRKPDLSFYRHVLDVAELDPLRTVFVDDKIENVVSAMSFGMKGIVFTTVKEVERSLGALLRDPVVDARRWLSSNAKRLWSMTNTDVALQENFGQLLLLELTQDWNLVDVVRSPKLSNFFRGKGVLTTAVFPDDLDTTSIACTVMDHYTVEVKNDIMDEMLRCKNQDGILQTYFDDTRPRIDPVVCVNALTFFYLNGRGNELTETLDWVYGVLTHRAYEHGTLYYHSGDAFLYFLSRLLRTAPAVRERFESLFTSRILERFGVAGDALALSMRVFAASSVGLCDAQDYERLLALQQDDGSWPLGWFYRNGSTGILTGNQGLTTAMAVAAIKAYMELEGRLSQKVQRTTDLLL
ncbi:HAD-like protein [Lentinus tigrinus ALCF2SS1-7]|nr:HAD-like protein [Lentinus tigrinus ALCF2SS1-7]